VIMANRQKVIALTLTMLLGVRIAILRLLIFRLDREVYASVAGAEGPGCPMGHQDIRTVVTRGSLKMEQN
jgi:hypothetical protein